MDLGTFISGSLAGIIDGVCDAQVHAKEKGALVSPLGVHIAGDFAGPYVLPGVLGQDAAQVQTVEFDVAVAVTKETEAKGGIAVVYAILGASGQARMQEGTGETARLKFSVPIVLPHQKKG